MLLCFVLGFRGCRRAPSQPTFALHASGGKVAAAKALEGCDACVVSLGGDYTICSTATPTILEAARAAGVKKVLVITSLGCGDSYPRVSFFTKLLVDWLLYKTIADKNIQERFIRENAADMNWTILRPGGLTDKAGTGRYRMDAEITGGMISRKDVANAVLEVLSDSSERFKHATPSLVEA